MKFLLCADFLGGLFFFFVCFSETGFSGMRTPAARLESRPKKVADVRLSAGTYRNLAGEKSTIAPI